PRPGPYELGGFASRLAGAWWGSALALGLGTIALGVIALVWPGRTVAVLGVLFGIYLLVSGIVQFVHALGPRFTGGTRWLLFLSGTASVILGLLCFRSIAQSVVLLALWIAIGWLFRGGAELAAATAGGPGAGWSVALGVLSVLAGAVLLIFPIESVLVLAVVAGCWLIALGLLEIVAAFRLRRLSRRTA
ncbi:HdeD family acid-resistance protein, partial [Streptomyces alkaliphilus]|uniref:HdeD family acid-resistance protein n=1 Tax=Streptomyces alkaliphilus TaxID=1472722 RepID=UPI0027B8FB8F